MKKAKWFYCELYKENFYFLPAFSLKEVKAFTMRQFGFEYNVNLDKSDGKAIEVSNDERSAFIIWIRHNDKTDKNLAALTHECVHIAGWILGNRGIKITPDNDEPLTYLTEYIFKNCVKHLKEIKK